MNTVSRPAVRSLVLCCLLSLFAPVAAVAQPGPASAPAPARAATGPVRPGDGALASTPLPQALLSLLANEVSGQIAFNNEVLLAGAPRLRERGEFTGTMFEAQRIFDLVKSYGVETTSLERYPSQRTFDYPVEGELWITEPERRLVARLGADAALVASGTGTASVTGPLIYLPPLSPDEVKKMIADGPQERYKGKVALMWSHAREDTARALDAAGLAGVISFSSRDRYLDPNQVVYGGGSYKRPNLRMGLNVSWRQWSELLEDVLSGRRVVVRADTTVETFPDKFEAVYSWIPGTEPDAKGVVFTAHLFEGYVKRGANDDMSGCVVQLEVLRTLSRLISTGQIPRPRRTIAFLWPNEISGTYEFIRRHPDLVRQWSVNINMDMVGEALRKNNAVMTLSECPNHLPCYLDGLLTSLMNYVWRTNDIVYLPDAPRGRPGGQYFPVPMTEKNGSDDAFRFFVHQATGGSDHICFNNPSVGVPGVELFTWPDQWYHADADTPDKSDPTQMKRVAFIGAAAALAAADCTDGVLAGLLDAVSRFGYSRVAERELPRALAQLDAADAAGLEGATARALNLVEFALDRETGAVRSVEDVSSGSPVAKAAVGARLQQWELYRSALRSQVLGYAAARATALGVKTGRPSDRQKVSPPAAAGIENARPALAAAVKGREFSIGSFAPYTAYLKAHPDELKTLGITPPLANAILNYVNGRRTIAGIRGAVAAETGQDVPMGSVSGYLEILGRAGWLDAQSLKP